jgi:flagellum-specific peptidoglycan hydrolase FlgJ
MDSALADRLATSVDPKALAELRNNDRNPAVGRAIAGQFGAFLMQGLFQDASGDAIPMAGGTGGPAVSAMFASTMGRFAAAQDQLGLANTIYNSMTASHENAQGKPGAAAATPTTSASTPNSLESQSAFALTPYWQDGGHRPVGPVIRHVVVRSDAQTPSSTDAKTAATRSPAGTANAPLGTSRTAIPPKSSEASAPPETKAADPASGPTVQWRRMNISGWGQVLVPAKPASAGAPPATSSPDIGVARHRPEWTTGTVASSPANGDNEPTRPPTTATPASASNNSAIEHFSEEMAPALRQAAARLGVSPRILLAQAALETGWGRSVVGNNVFGVKAGGAWSGATVEARTQEVEGGHLIAQQGRFRSYSSVTQAVDDYVSLVSQSSRYRTALNAGNNVAAYANGLAAGGYATDPNYAAKLEQIADGPRMDDIVAALEEAAPGQLVSAHG